MFYLLSRLVMCSSSVLGGSFHGQETRWNSSRWHGNSFVRSKPCHETQMLICLYISRKYYYMIQSKPSFLYALLILLTNTSITNWKHIVTSQNQNIWRTRKFHSILILTFWYGFSIHHSEISVFFCCCLWLERKYVPETNFLFGTIVSIAATNILFVDLLVIPAFLGLASQDLLL